MPAVERSTLRVEGPDDAHSIKHLLRQHHCICPIGKEQTESYTENAPAIHAAGSVTALLEGMGDTIRFSSGRSAGFILDADDAPAVRWQEVRSHVETIGVELPHEIPTKGYVTEDRQHRVRIGIWIMPDNQRPGALEPFLRDLVDPNDLLLPLAERSTDIAKKTGASFPDSRRDKAIMRTWLAWQEEPGLPYGLAVGKHYFRHDTALAGRFVDWFKQVFECG